MHKDIKLIVYQIKRIGKDNLMLLLLVYPALLAAVGKLSIPFFRDAFIEDFDLMNHYPAILVFFIIANPYIYGALAAFTLLDEREENVLLAIRVTPLTLSHYLGTKVFFFSIVSILSGMFITWFLDLVTISFVESFVINTLIAMSAPFSMILINSFANNRVEGFALVKGTSLMIILPLTAFYVPEKWNLLLGCIPGYWPAMSINKLANPSFGFMPYWGYSLAGFLYILILIALCFRRFKRRIS
ncbi:fluoroquinolone transport system permease protein [Peptoclostridium litorale DSM 5388]|uniref:ABC-type transport system, permease component n=2 Tax=Peptoclostridium litorale TaxID=1557 RepID=A0A069REM2_PEPLI|nr:ABC-type transport system, permease component [Peptoclostridium litorale DSM 5388]SIN72850.1 fluoroquinolone transport system permease protein [Peptoclostridium litorale DSM 5388]